MKNTILRTILTKEKCAVCTNSLEKAETVESISMDGVFYVKCSKCGKIYMTAGSTLIELPREQLNDLTASLFSLGLKEIKAMPMENNKMPKIKVLGLGGTGSKEEEAEIMGIMRHILPEALSSIIDPEMIKTGLEDELKTTFPTFKQKNPGSFIGFDPQQNTEPITEEKKEETKNNDEVTKYVVLDDEGDVYEEYSAQYTSNEVFEDIIDNFGIEALTERRFTVHELKEIKPKLKTQTTYVLDK